MNKSIRVVKNGNKNFNQKPKGKPLDLDEIFKDKRVVLVMKGREIITGVWETVSGNTIKINEAKVTGSKHFVPNLPFIIVEKNAVAHIHLETPFLPIQDVV